MPNGAFPLDGFDIWLQEPTVAEALLDSATAATSAVHAPRAKVHE